MAASIKVKVHQAYLIINDERRRLTKAVAKQFPVLSATERWRAMEQGETVPEPLGKIQGSVLGRTWEWLYLVPDETAGLAWVAAEQVDSRYEEIIVTRGGYVDHPENVPTLIL